MVNYPSAAVLLSLCLVTVPMVAANEPPLADAGLDQVVTLGDTVYLDGRGTADPDGSIAAYAWSIRTPNGATVSPDCATCATTHFAPTQRGRHVVTMTATDDDGATATDTLYVDVDPGAPPTLDLSGPNTVTSGDTAPFVARVTAAAAPLSELVWRVDGRYVDRVPVATGDEITLRPRFGTDGRHHVEATLVATDGQQVTERSAIVAHSPEPTTFAAGTGARTITSSETPTIRGPRVVTGAQPLTATYHAAGTPTGTPTWFLNGRSIAAGDSTSLSLDPGYHTLYAVDADDTPIRFPDGTTTIVADPKPDLTVHTIDGRGGIRVDLHATDAFGNLASLTVAIDGEPAATRSYDLVETRKDDVGRRLALQATLPADPGNHTVVVHARDTRGQETLHRQPITVAGPPEIVSAEFVTDGPLDSYHPRIDPERYAAHHVLTVDLNGVDREAIEAAVVSKDGLTRPVTEPGFSRTTDYDAGEDRLMIHTYWGRETPGIGQASASLTWLAVDRSPIDKAGSSHFEVTPSIPEIRIDVLSGGVDRTPTNWGLVVDAGGSFDPDRTNLTYNWKGGAKPSPADSAVAKFDSFNFPVLEVRDQQEQIAVKRGHFVEYLNPGFGSFTELTEGPYLPGENVQFRVVSAEYELPKNRYRDDISVGLDVDQGRVLADHRQGGTFAGDPQQEDDHADQSAESHSWIIEVPAEAFTTSRAPEVSMFSNYYPDQTRVTEILPDVTVLQNGSPTVQVSNVDTSYVVHQPIYTTRRAVHPDVRDHYLSQGYEIHRAENTGTEYVLEKYVQISPARYENQTQVFSSRGRFNAFLGRNPAWQHDGVTTVTERWMTTDYVWRADQSGEGRLTGQTRKVVTDPAEYHTYRQYRYQYQIQQTGTRIVTRERTFRLPDGRRYTDTWEEEVEYEYTVTKSDTYWSLSKQHWSHDYTGTSKRVKVQDAEYTTQYRYAVQRTQSRIESRYSAKLVQKVQPAVYEWERYRTTKSDLAVNEVSTAPNIRVRGTQPATEWTLRRQTGARRLVFDEYSQPSKVHETLISAELTTMMHYENLETREQAERTQQTEQYRTSGTGYIPVEEAIAKIEEEQR